jgi:hypothetical protein
MKVTLQFHGTYQIPGLEDDESDQIRAFHKKERASITAASLGLVKAVHRDAVEFTGITNQQQGLATLLGLVGLVGGGGFSGWLAWELPSSSIKWHESVASQVFSFFMSSIMVAMLLFCIGGFLYLFRADMFSPRDLPMVFDRKSRKVYRVFRDIPAMVPYVKRLFRFQSPFHEWPVIAVEYDWDCLDFVQLRKFIMAGQVPTMAHTLGVKVRESKDSDKLIDTFTIGQPFSMNEDDVPRLWEYLRRFMEEHGPALPKGDEMAFARPRSWWQSMGEVSPIGPKFRTWWKEADTVVLVTVAFFPLVVPFFLVWGTLNWLANKTGRDLDWPDELRQQLGPVIETKYG